MCKSYDGGKSWKHKFVLDSIGYTEYAFSGEKYKFTFSANKYGLFAVDRGSNKTYKSNDNGENWEHYSNFSAFFMDNDKNMYEKNDTLFFLFENYSNKRIKYFYTSLDTGRTWSMYDSLYLQKLPENSEHLFIRNGHCFSINKTNAIYESSNEGKNWNLYAQVNVPIKDSLYSLIFSNAITEKPILLFAYKEKPGYVFTQKSLISTIYYTDNLGQTFKQFKLPLINGKIYPDNYKFVYSQGRVLILLQDFEQKFSGLFNFNPEKNALTDIAPDLEGNVITDILTVEDYLYISTYEGLFRIKVEPVSVKEEIEKITLLPIELYPNPAKDKVRLQNNYYQLKNITIYNIMGQEVKKPIWTKSEFEVNGLPAGVYIVKLEFDDGWFVHRKLLKN